jgi:hypothetical protein
MSLTRQYALKYLQNDEIKNILKYFNCNLQQNISLKSIIDSLSNKFINKRLENEDINKNIQFLQSLYITRPNILNLNISSF